MSFRCLTGIQWIQYAHPPLEIYSFTFVQTSSDLVFSMCAIALLQEWPAPQRVRDEMHIFTQTWKLTKVESLLRP